MWHCSWYTSTGPSYSYSGYAREMVSRVAGRLQRAVPVSATVFFDCVRATLTSPPTLDAPGIFHAGRSPDSATSPVNTRTSGIG